MKRQDLAPKQTLFCDGYAKLLMLRRFTDKLSRLLKHFELFKMSELNEVKEAELHEVKDGRVEKKHGKERAKFERVKTYRYAMLVGYQGKNYYGMQVQKGTNAAPTIESHLLHALLKNGWITQEMHDKPFAFYFQRAARTDKAVSAVRQLCSLQLPRMPDLPEVGAAKMNEHLPSDIRVFGFRRATTNFHSQKCCDARTYSYTLPTFAFAKPHEKTDASFRITKESLQEINDVLGLYVGTHNFFNYTSRVQFEDRSCNRYILQFSAGEPFLHTDEFRKQEVEFVTLTVKGQSFMLHQIRKMVGMMISVVRELQNKCTVQRSFENQRMDVPKAPGLGLLLERLHFHQYDKKFADSHEPLSDWGELIEHNIEDMKAKYITKEILDTELREQSMMRWLSDLVQHHNFLADPSVEEVPTDTFVAGAAKTAKEAQEELATREEKEASS